MSSQHLPEPLMSPFCDQMQVDVAEGGQVAVGVAGDRLIVVAVRGGDPIRDRGSVVLRLPDTVRDVVKLESAPVPEDRRDRGGERATGADHRDGAIARVGERVRAEHGMRVVVGTGRHRSPVR